MVGSRGNGAACACEKRSEEGVVDGLGSGPAPDLATNFNGEAMIRKASRDSLPRLLWTCIKERNSLDHTSSHCGVFARFGLTGKSVST